jgi:hypothetical protein
MDWLDFEQGAGGRRSKGKANKAGRWSVRACTRTTARVASQVGKHPRQVCFRGVPCHAAAPRHRFQYCTKPRGKARVKICRCCTRSQEWTEPHVQAVPAVATRHVYHCRRIVRNWFQSQVFQPQAPAARMKRQQQQQRQQKPSSQENPFPLPRPPREPRPTVTLAASGGRRIQFSFGCL